MKYKILDKIIRNYKIYNKMTLTNYQIEKIANEMRIEIEDICKILRIKKEDRRKILKRKYCETVINIMNEEEFLKIKKELKNDIIYIKELKEQDLSRLQNKYKVDYKFIKNYFNSIKYSNKYNIDYRLLYSCYDDIINEYQYKDKLYYNDILNIVNKYNLKEYDISKIMKISYENIKKLCRGTTKYIKIDLLSNEEKENIKQKIREMFNNREIIYNKDIEYIYLNIKTTEKLIKEALCIDNELYYALKKNKTSNVVINNKDAKEKVEMFLMNIKYSNKKYNKYYSQDDLKKVAIKLEIEFKMLLKYITNNPRHYNLNLSIINNNKKGLWIGENGSLTIDFIKEYNKTIKEISIKTVNELLKFEYSNNFRRELFQEKVYDYLIQNSLVIEKNFNFDIKFLFNILRKKARNILKNYIRYEAKLLNYNNLKDKINNYIKEDLIYTLSDNTYTPERTIFFSYNKIIENINNINIDDKYKRVLNIVNKYSELIRINRSYGLLKIANDINYSIVETEKIIKDIKEILIKHNFVKQVTNKKILPMYEYYY